MRATRLNVIGGTVLAFAGVWLGFRLRVAYQRTVFEAVCARTEGASYEEADAAIAQRGHVAVGLRVTSGEEPVGGSFSVSPGWSARRFACAFDLRNGRVVAPHVEVRHHFDLCTDRDSFPRRWWLCRIGRGLIP